MKSRKISTKKANELKVDDRVKVGGIYRCIHKITKNNKGITVLCGHPEKTFILKDMESVKISIR